MRIRPSVRGALLAGALLAGALLVGPASGEGIPSNDRCEVAVPIVVGDTVSGSTEGATTHTDLDPCGSSVTGPGVWYEVIGTGRRMTASTCESVGDPVGAADYDSRISVFCPDCNFNLCVADNDDAPDCEFHSAVSWCSNYGATYKLLVHGFGQASGSFDLSISDGSDCSSESACFGVPVILGACCDASGEGCLGNSPQGLCGQRGRFQGFATSCRSTVRHRAFESSPVVAIPDDDFLGASDSIYVADDVEVYDVAVGLSIVHEAVGDLSITLTSPSGTVRRLWHRTCGDADAILATAVDRVADPVDCDALASGPVETTRFSPSQRLAILDGESSRGSWTLEVRDLESGNTGTFARWSLQLAETVATCPTEQPQPGTTIRHRPD